MRKQIHLPLPDHRIVAAVIAILCAGLYLRTMAPTAAWYDMAEMAAAAYYLGIAHHTGYPLYVLLGKLFTFIPLGDIGYRVNLMSAAFAVGTVIVVFFIVWDLTHRRSAAALTALTLGVSSTLWSNATLAESYTLNAFFTALLTYLLFTWQRTSRRGPLLIAFYLLGLAMGNHHLIQFFGPAILIYWGAVHWHREHHLPWKDLSLFLVLFLAGFAINLYLPIRAAQKPVIMWADASDWRIFLSMITTGKQSQSTFITPKANLAATHIHIKAMLLFPLYEFTAVGLALALWGAVRLWRDNRPLLLHSLVGGGLTLLMILVYVIHNIFQYFLPIYVMAAICLGVGINALLDLPLRWQSKHPEGSTRAISLRMIPLLLSFLLMGLPLYLVGRDFNVLDRSRDASSYHYANYLSGQLEPDARLLADFWAWAPLAYYQTVGGWRSDVLTYPVLSAHGVKWDEFLSDLRTEDAPIYVASGGPIPPPLLENVDLQPVGLQMIETVTDFQVPRPRYKDVWLPRGNLYRIVHSPASPAIGFIPTSREIEEIHFGDTLSLVGFGGPTRPLRIGSATKLSYYWVINNPTDLNYYVSVQFEDANGYVRLLRDLSIWDHSHIIGTISPTSTWAPDTVMCERYDTLIPWRIPSGHYTVKIWVYKDRAKTHLIPATGIANPEEGVPIGRIEVLPQRSPFDIEPRHAPRE